MGPCKGARSTPAMRTQVERWSPLGALGRIMPLFPSPSPSYSQEPKDHKWQERMIFLNREFYGVGSSCSRKLSQVPSQPAVVPSLCGMLCRDQSLRPDTWNLLGTPGNVLDSPRAAINSSSTPHQGTLHLLESRCYRRETQYETVH